jgi:hypothetical protein
MGTALIARAATASAISAPWLVWLPVARGPTTVVVTGAIAIVGAFHGWGRGVARLARIREPNAVLAIWWGVAMTIALAGGAIALHVYDPRLLVIAGTVAHSVDLAVRFDAASARVEDALCWRAVRCWLVPVAVLLALALIHLLGTAGAVGARPFDDDGHVIAQVRRLLDTGALTDPIGYARGSQLGGHVALCGLVGGFADVRTARMIDGGIGFTLVLALALASLRPRDPSSAVWATLLLLLGSGAAIRWGELAPLWIAAGLLVASYLTLRDAGAVLPVALLAGAAIVLRGELVLPAVVFAVATWWRGRKPWRTDLVRVATLAAGVLATVVPYVLARVLAWASIDGSARALLEPSRDGLAGRLGMAAGIALAVTPILWLPSRELTDTRVRWFGVAVAAGLAAIASRLGTEQPFAGRFAWVFAAAGMVVLAIELGVQRELPRVALVVAALACVLIDDGRLLAGRLGWSARYVALFEDAEYGRYASAVDDDGYASSFASIPHADTVAVWLARPETLDYAQHHIVDLRTPRSARLRVPGADDRRFERLLTASHARWLVFEADDAFRDRARDSGLYALLCARDFPWCADSLEAVALHHRVVAEHDGVQVLDLR